MVTCGAPTTCSDIRKAEPSPTGYVNPSQLISNPSLLCSGQVTRLETAEDEVLQKLGDLVGDDKKAGNLDVKNLKFRPTEIEYEDEGAGADVDVKETDEGLQVRGEISGAAASRSYDIF